MGAFGCWEITKWIMIYCLFYQIILKLYVKTWLIPALRFRIFSTPCVNSAICLNSFLLKSPTDTTHYESSASSTLVANSPCVVGARDVRNISSWRTNSHDLRSRCSPIQTSPNSGQPAGARCPFRPSAIFLSLPTGQQKCLDLKTSIREASALRSTCPTFTNSAINYSATCRHTKSGSNTYPICHSNTLNDPHPKRFHPQSQTEHSANHTKVHRSDWRIRLHINGRWRVIACTANLPRTTNAKCSIRVLHSATHSNRTVLAHSKRQVQAQAPPPPRPSRSLQNCRQTRTSSLAWRHRYSHLKPNIYARESTATQLRCILRVRWTRLFARAACASGWCGTRTGRWPSTSVSWYIRQATQVVSANSVEQFVINVCCAREKCRSLQWLWNGTERWQVVSIILFDNDGHIHIMFLCVQWSKY